MNRDATSGEIKKSYRRLALQFHPDKPGGDERRFKQLNAAFQVLNDPELRGVYDQLRATGVEEATEAQWKKASSEWASESPEEDGKPKDDGVAPERKGDAPHAAPRGLRNRLRAKLYEMFGKN